MSDPWLPWNAPGVIRICLQWGEERLQVSIKLPADNRTQQPGGAGTDALPPPPTRATPAWGSYPADDAPWASAVTSGTSGTYCVA